MRGFAARGGAGVQQTVPHRERVLLLHGVGSQLGRAVLHRAPAVGKARQCLDANGILQTHAVIAPRLPGQAGLSQQGQIALHIGAPAIDTQHHGCRPVGGLQHRLPVLRILGLQAANPPQGVVPARLIVLQRLRQQGLTLAQIAAQAGVQQASGKAGIALGFGRLDHLAHQGVGRIRGLLRAIARLQQRQGGVQQRTHRGRGRARHQEALQRTCGSPLAHDMKGQGLGARSQARLNLGQPFTQGLATRDITDTRGGGQQQSRQRHWRGRSIGHTRPFNTRKKSPDAQAPGQDLVTRRREPTGPRRGHQAALSLSAAACWSAARASASASAMARRSSSSIFSLTLRASW